MSDDPEVILAKPTQVNIQPLKDGGARLTARVRLKEDRGGEMVVYDRAFSEVEDARREAVEVIHTNFRVPAWINEPDF